MSGEQIGIGPFQEINRPVSSEMVVTPVNRGVAVWAGEILDATSERFFGLNNFGREIFTPAAADALWSRVNTSFNYSLDGKSLPLAEADHYLFDGMDVNLVAALKSTLLGATAAATNRGESFAGRYDFAADQFIQKWSDTVKQDLEELPEASAFERKIQEQLDILASNIGMTLEEFKLWSEKIAQDGMDALSPLPARRAAGIATAAVVLGYLATSFSPAPVFAKEAAPASASPHIAEIVMDSLTPKPTDVLPTLKTTSSIPESAAIPKPIEADMPEGWTEVAETKEIGGRQVLFNENGDAATEIDGVFYPVDAKGCYYPELLSDEVQKHLEVVKAHEKLMSEPSLTKDDANEYQRYKGSMYKAMIKGEFPGIYETAFDAQLVRQTLCFQDGKWHHVMDYAIAKNMVNAPDDSTLMRAVVGWFEGDHQYKTFTYLEKSSERVKHSVDLTNASSVKGKDISAAFELWESVISSGKQCSVRMPAGISENKDGTSDGNYDSLLDQLMNSAHGTLPRYWTARINDPVLREWAKDKNNQEWYFSDSKRITEWLQQNKKTLWSTWLNRVLSGKMPIPHISGIVVSE